MDHALGPLSKYMTTIYNYFCIKITFLDFLKVKNLGKYAPKRTKLHHSKKHFGEACLQTPLANAWLRHASQATPPPPKKKFGSNLMGQQHYKRVSEKIHVYL